MREWKWERRRDTKREIERNRWYNVIKYYLNEWVCECMIWDIFKTCEKERERHFAFYENIGGDIEVKRSKIKCNTMVAINEVKDETNIESDAKCLHSDH